MALVINYEETTSIRVNLTEDDTIRISAFIHINSDQDPQITIYQGLSAISVETWDKFVVALNAELACL